MIDSGDISKFEVDGKTPERVARPSTLDELSTALAEAHASGEAVVPWGGGTRMHVGNLPERYTVALDMTGLSGNVVHEPGDLTVFADGGVTIAELQKTLALSAQRLPFDVSEPGTATLGGSVASNAGGQMRSSLGGIRDWVIGMKVVLADGTVTKSGGRVVKNVQGYDLHRLHTGAFGTLGVIAEVALKVAPMPASMSTVAVWFGSVSEAGEYAMHVFNGPAQPDAMTLFAGRGAAAAMSSLTGSTGNSNDGSTVLVLARVAGGSEAVSRMESDLTGAAGSMGAAGYELARGGDAEKLWQAAVAGGKDGAKTAGATLSARSTLKPREAVMYLDDVTRDLVAEDFSGELQTGFGTVTVALQNPTRAALDALRERAARRGAQAMIERCPVDLKREVDVFGDSGDALNLMRSVKRRFDPQRVLNPGRFAGRI